MRKEALILPAQLMSDLLSLHAPEPSIISLYIDLSDPSETPGSLLRRLSSLRGDRQEFCRDMAAIERYLAEASDRSCVGNARGLAVFSAYGLGLWRVCPLPEPVLDRLVIDSKPYLAPLLSMAGQHRRFGVVLAGPRRARFLEAYMGQIQEHEGLALAPGEGARANLKTLAGALDKFLREKAVERVVIGASPEFAIPLSEGLHDSLRRDAILDAAMSPDLAASEVLELVSSIEKEARRLRERVLVHRLLGAARPEESAVFGLDKTLAALQNGRVRVLLVRDGYAKMGRSCPSCGELSRHWPKCARCSKPTHAVFNLVNEMVQKALDLNCEVFRLIDGSPLDNLGKIGAMLGLEGT